MPSRPQPGDAFGLAEVAWDAWMLQGDPGFDGLSLDLLVWTTPPPTGAPPPTPWAPGLHHMVLTVPELDVVLADRFWIPTKPSYHDQIRGRHEDMQTLRQPASPVLD